MTRDEAIAAALAESLPGDILTIHEDRCGSADASTCEEEAKCDCSPMELVVGATA